MLALSQYYTERKTILHDIPIRKDNHVTNIKAVKSSATSRSTPLQMLSSMTTQPMTPRGNISSIIANRPRKLTPMDSQNHKTLAMAVEESHHRFLGNNKNNPFDKNTNEGLAILNKRGGAKRGGAGYAAAASRALQIPTNISTPITPTNSPQGSSQSLNKVSTSVIESNMANDEVFDNSRNKTNDDIIGSKNSSPALNLLRKNTFSLEEPSKFEFSSNIQKLQAIVP